MRRGSSNATSCLSRRRSTKVARDVAGTKYEAVWKRLLEVPVRSMAESCFEDPRIAAAAIGLGDYGAISEPGSALAQTYFKMSFLTADEDLGIVRGGDGRYNASDGEVRAGGGGHYTDERPRQLGQRE